MAPPESSAILRYDNLLASSRGLTETHGKKLVLFVPAAEIGHVGLKFGHTAHRPIFNMILGIILIPIGLYGIYDFFLRPAGLRYEMAMAAFGLIGGSLIFDTLKKRYFLEVHRPKDTARLIFSKQAVLEEILDFCTQVETAYPYRITSGIEPRGAPARPQTE